MRSIATLAILITACRGAPDPTPFCSDTPAELPPPATPAPTYWRDVKPVLDAACGYCHQAEGLAPFSLEDAHEVVPIAPAIRDAVVARRMPPYLAAPCCQSYYRDYSLTDVEIATIAAWADAGAPPGDPADEPPPLPSRGGLSRVDATLTMAEPYAPEPANGRIDETRCFAVPWPIADEVYVTGLNTVPGDRKLVHHLMVAFVDADLADKVHELEAADDRPGWDCRGGFGGLGWQDVHYLGGQLLGGDFPDGLGKSVDPGSIVIFNIHYTTANGPGVDQTRIELKLDATARDFQNIPIANAAWMVDDAFHIDAGDPDAVFWYQYEPKLFTRGKRVYLRSVTPHMHSFGTRMVVRVVRAEEDRTCLLEITAWDPGWTQMYWLAEPVALDPGDELYLECHFDNSAANQPGGAEPRDIGWGPENQDMCAAFLNFTEER